MKNEKQNERMANGQQVQGIQNIPMVEVKITFSANKPPGIFLALLQPSDRCQGIKGGNNTLQSYIIGKAPPVHSCSPGL